MIIILRAAQRIGGQALIWLDNDKEKEIKVDNIVESNFICSQLYVAFVPEGTPLAYLRSVIGSLLSAHLT